MSDIDVNIIQQNVKELQDQNAIDFQQWKKLGKDIEKLSEKIKLSDTNLNLLMKKIKNDYENLKKIIIDENIQVQLINKIEDNKNQINKKVSNETFENKVNVINSNIEDNKNQIIKKVNNETFQNTVNEINSQINNIANKGTTVEVLERVTKEEIDRQIADGTIANLTIQDDSITINKVNFIKKGKNLFNKESETIRNGVTFNNNTGIESSDDKKFIEEININQNLQITISGSLGTWQFNDEKGNRLTGSNFFTDSVTLTPPTNAFILKVALLIEKKNSIQIEYGSEQTIYEEFYYDIPYLKKETNNTSSEDTIEKSINLFNPMSEDILYDKNIASNGNIQPFNDWFISDYMEIDNSFKYTIKNINIKGSALWGYYQTYDKAKKVVTKRNRFDNNAELTFTSDEKYIRITASSIYCTESGYNKLVIGKFDEVKGFIKYGNNVKNLNLVKENIQPNFYNLYGKKMCGYGDSNTGNKMWQQYVVDKFGLEYIHKGIGGTTAIGRCSDEELNKLPRDLDLFILNFGTNDISQGVPVGELPPWGIDYNYEFDTTTYIGALCKIVRYISVNIPHCRIIIMTPLYRSNSKLNQTSNEFPNFNKYIQGCKAIADRFGCEYIDLYSKLGINLWNYPFYFLDESTNKDGDCWSVHLNDLGGKRVGAIVCKTIENLEPII